LDASTVFSSLGTASGIVVTRREVVGTVVNSVIQPVRLDLGGVIDPSNAAPTSGATPPVLRLYYDPDNDLTTAQSFPAGAYTVSLTNQLRAINGAPFCVAGTGSNCAASNSFLPSISFTIGADVSALTMAGDPNTGAGASNITQGDTGVPIDRQIQLNFSKAVAFDTLVGAGNLTTLDPFITVPFPVIAAGNCGGTPPAGVGIIQIGNIHISYRAPVDPISGAIDPPPANLGVVVYMPDPFLSPGMVRIRFVDVTNLVGTQNLATQTFQNYASNSVKLPIASSDPARSGTLLSLPPTIPVPGSGPTYTTAQGFLDPARLEIGVAVESATFGDPFGFACLPSGGGATDRVNLNPNVTPSVPIAPNGFVFNGLASDYFLRFIFARGPILSKNPMPPDATFVGRQQGNLVGLATINTASITSGAPGFSVPVAAGATVTGNISISPNPLTNTAVLGTPTDIEIGSWIIYQQLGAATALNSFDNPGRGASNIPGVPDAQNGSTPRGLLDLFGVLPNPSPPLQPWGNFVYVVDGDASTVKVMNGYNFQLITSLVGVASPSGLGISPNLDFLYVSNFTSNTVTQVFANPVSPSFHTIANVISVGPGPTAITVNPANEDIFVANFGGNSFSIIDRPSATQRVELSSGGILGPTDIFCTNRMAGQGLTNAYTAFVTGRFSNAVVIYESDSPAVPENTIQGVIKGSVAGLSGPTRGSWNWQSYIGLATGPGCFVANSTGTTVDEIILTNFTLSPPPGFPGQPGQRTYITNKQFQATQVPGLSSTSRPTDATVETMSGKGVPQVGNNKAAADPAVGGGAPSVVLVSYPSAGVVAAFAYDSPILLGSASVPGCDFLHSYYDQ
jgi:hypothetical protein